VVGGGEQENNKVNVERHLPLLNILTMVMVICVRVIQLT